MKAGKLMLGLILLTVGTLTLLDSLDVSDMSHLGRYWPVILIALGLSGEIDALRRRKSDGSFILLAVGVWFLAGMQRFLALSVGEAMPLGVIVAGAFVVLHAIVDRPAAETKSEENSHAC